MTLTLHHHPLSSFRRKAAGGDFTARALKEAEPFNALMAIKPGEGTPL